MRLEATFVGKRQHFVVYSGRVAYSKHGNAAVDKFFGNPVDGHVRLGADQYLRLAHQRFVDGLNEGGGLAGAGRSVNNHHVFGL